MQRESLMAIALCGSTFLAAPGFALEAPTGTEIQIRLKTKVSTGSSRQGDAVESVVIAPVMVGSQFLIPAGAIVRGTVEKAAQSTNSDERAVLALRFGEIEINGSRLKLSAQIASVDNAREEVDEQGQINGILASETMSSRLDSSIEKLSQNHSGLADFLRQAKNAVLKPVDTSISYDAGVEMNLRLVQPFSLAAAAGPGRTGQAGPIPGAAALAALVAREPFQTIAQNPPKPSDITNVLLIASEEAVKESFRQAGWSAAAKLSEASKLETFRAVAEDRGYSEAPVSVLLLDDKAPEVVFEKTNNTFARRHHLRIWRRPDSFLGKPVWAVAATHDIGINYSEADRTFIHRIDSQIDKERAKVVTDLLFTGLVQGIELVDRPNVPRHSQNATGDSLETDGKMAVLLLREQ
jgi:LssY C-terminus